ncbi:MAG TPA: hypothetical protein VJ836_02485 [Candidatus Saccharimonadales bacterium]|nr:hypothetical protein [Candidatus Saccharimonadales bacterium]
MSITAENEFEPGIYAVSNVDYQFGDGAVKNDGRPDNERYTYAKAGSYVVRADMIMETTPDGNAPFKNGATIPCAPTTVIIQ